MSRTDRTLDVISNLALAGAAATLLVRPTLVARIAASPVGATDRASDPPGGAAPDTAAARRPSTRARNCNG